MFRVAAVAALILAFSGCLSPASTHIQDVEDLAPDDGLKVTATRVEPLVHSVDEWGRIQNQPCQHEGCQQLPLGTFAGYEVEAPQRDFGDPLALFWRVSLHADWTTKGLPNTVLMTVYATTPCGIDCIRTREIQSDATGTSPGFDSLDVYLKPGETGVRVRLDVQDSTAAFGDAGIDYHLHGIVGGYRAVAPPVTLV